VDVFINSVVRLSMSYRLCGVGTKFNTRDNEIKSYFCYQYIKNPQGGITSPSARGRVIKSCSSIRGSLDFKSIRRMEPFRCSTNFAIALSHSKQPTSSTLVPSVCAALSHGTSIFDESPPCCGSCPLDEACWYVANWPSSRGLFAFKSLWRDFITSRRCVLLMVVCVRGFFRLMVFRCDPIGPGAVKFRFG